MGFLRTDARPGKWTQLVLSLVLFVVLIGAYLGGAYHRHRKNPQDRIMPLPSKMVEGVKNVAFKEDRKGDLRLWVDTWASSKRFGIAIAIIFLAVIVGLYMGVFPYVEAFLYRFLVAFDKIPALSLLPILFILFGIKETTKIALIVIGVFPTVALDAYLRAKALPREQIYKAQSLGASEQEIAFRIVLPQIFPKILDTIRLNFKAAMLLLIAGESIAATVGLGYRIFQVRRFVAMEIIIPYVIWMTLLLFLADYAVQWWIKSRHRWLDK
jgi:NitT/TauT family transport system permease protein